MQYILVIAKEVAFPPEAFITTWNADPTCRALAEADIDCSTKVVYEPDSRVSLPLLEATNQDASNVPPLMGHQRRSGLSSGRRKPEIVA